MTWKPTDEMVKVAWEVLQYEHIFPQGVEPVLIAVQPLIAAEALGEYAAIVAPAAAALVERTQAEARAKALEEAAKIIEYWSPLSEAADAIRSLIPKPSDAP